MTTKHRSTTKGEIQMLRIKRLYKNVITLEGLDFRYHIDGNTMFDVIKHFCTKEITYW